MSCRAHQGGFRFGLQDRDLILRRGLFRLFRRGIGSGRCRRLQGQELFAGDQRDIGDLNRRHRVGVEQRAAEQRHRQDDGMRADRYFGAGLQPATLVF